ncbi:MAG: hypothetical protein H0U45_07625, partial [Tatlockia sp.]|nr:hypothetical protein [Tatlockia sp.]
MGANLNPKTIDSWSNLIYNECLISVQLREAIATRHRNLSSLQAQISQAKATLNRIAEVRPVDVQ